MTDSLFTVHTTESAPPAAAPLMRRTADHLGYLPAAMALMAESPDLLKGFLTASGQFEQTTLDPVAREVLIMTVAVRNGCHVCVAMHSARLAALGADPSLALALRTGELALPDRYLEGLRAFTLAVMASAGGVGEGVVQEFLGNGYTRRNALEVALGIGAYTMSTLANRMTGAAADPQLAAFAS